MSISEPVDQVDAREQREALIWAAVEYLAKKKGRRDLLPPGSATTVVLRIAGDIGGKTALSTEADGTLHVGHDSVQVASVAPEPAVLVAYFLAHLPEGTVPRVCEELIELYQEKRLTFRPYIREAAKNLLAQLRASKEQPKRGSVSLHYRTLY